MRFTDLPNHARVWVYVANRQLTDSEVEGCKKHIDSFAAQWTAHNRSLQAAGDVIHNRFLILGVDESMAGASGCSIDSSVRFIQKLGATIQADFFERMTFFVDNGKGFWPYSREAFEKAYQTGEISTDSAAIDPLVKTKAEFDEAFVKPLGTSWHMRFV